MELQFEGGMEGISPWGQPKSLLLEKKTKRTIKENFNKKIFR